MPTLIYDGDCGFCLRWVNWLRPKVPSGVEFTASSMVRDRFQSIPPEAYAEAIHLVRTDGTYSRGAEAFFELLGENPKLKRWIQLYRWSAPFRWASEGLYRWVAKHRPEATFLLSFLWGPSMPFSTRYHRIRPLLERGLGLVYLVAFASLWVQHEELWGPDGVLPMRDFLAGLRESRVGFLTVPSVFWISSHPSWMNLSLVMGMIFAVAILFQRRVGLASVGAWVIYLSWVNVGQEFLGFQWEMLLLQSGSILMVSQAFRSDRHSIFLYRLLLFVLLFQSGWAKLTSGDTTWTNLTALKFHLVTTPIPTEIGRLFYFLPSGLLQLATALTLAFECIVPLSFWAPRNVRAGAFFLHLVFQLGIVATGHYGYFNLLSLALSLSLWEDSLPPFSVVDWRMTGATCTRGVLGVSLWALLMVFGTRLHALDGWHLSGNYGLFSVMTTERRELTIEGFDGREWLPFQFRWKPNSSQSRPGWLLFHMPRLDWQMWFAALGDCENQRWLHHLLFRLLQGKIDHLILKTSFKSTPPKKIRVTKQEFSFTRPGTSENFWSSGDPTVYCPEVGF